MKPLCVLGLDGADYDLATRWGCENLLLDKDYPLETYSYTIDQPLTPEVWTTVATGFGPAEHGIAGDIQNWDSGLLNAASNLTQYLPHTARWLLGLPFRVTGAAEQELAQTGFDHPFDAVWTWPGITDAEHLEEAWALKNDILNGDATVREAQRRLRENACKELGWLATWAATHETGLVGVHTHLLDTFGHVYCKRPTKLRAEYEYMDSLVGWLRSNVDRLIILSDHGMVNKASDDADFGSHSMRAMVSCTNAVGGEVPRSVYGIRQWIADQSTPAEQTKSDGAGENAIDTPEEILRDLGYVE